MLNKLELEKLKVGNILECNLSDGTKYYLKIKQIKLGKNGYRIKSEPIIFTNFKTNIFNDVCKNFTINGSFRNDGTHYLGPNRLIRSYNLIESNNNTAIEIYSENKEINKKLLSWSKNTKLNIQKKDNLFYYITWPKNATQHQYDIILNLESFNIDCNDKDLNIRINHNFKI